MVKYKYSYVHTNIKLIFGCLINPDVFLYDLPKKRCLIG